MGGEGVREIESEDERDVIMELGPAERERERVCVFERERALNQVIITSPQILHTSNDDI